MSKGFELVKNVNLFGIKSNYCSLSININRKLKETEKFYDIIWFLIMHGSFQLILHGRQVEFIAHLNLHFRVFIVMEISIKLCFQVSLEFLHINTTDFQVI